MASLALITCADHGAGRAIAEELADREMDVILTARSEAAARHATERLWEKGLDTVRPRLLDPASPSTIARLRERIAQDGGMLDVIVLWGLDGGEAEAVRQGLAHVTRADARVVTVDGDDAATALDQLGG
jgi:NAD(P)-dependent dehydrogenase (short-subunit alcohol dehydrogenase family)